MSELENSQSSELENSQSRTEVTAYTPLSFLPETTASRKSQHLLDVTVDALLQRTGIARVLFITLTFPKYIRSTKVAHDKLNSFLNAVRKRHAGYIWVLEPQKSGRIHYHLLIPMDFDCHVGTDLDAWRDRSSPMEGQYFHSEDPARCGVFTHDTFLYNSMNPVLQAEADWWKGTAETHGFGRVQVAPIYGGAETVRRYLTKQSWRTQHWPFKERKNVRFWGCSQKLRVGNTRFAWNSPGARKGRQRLEAWAKGYGCATYEDLPRVLGRYWNRRHYCECILGMEPEPLPSAYHHMRYNDPSFPFQRNPATWPPQPDNQPSSHSPRSFAGSDEAWFALSGSDSSLDSRI